MSVYNLNGQALANVYGVSGSSLSYAYDKSGNVIFTNAPVTLKVMTYNVGQWYVGNTNRVPAAQKTEYYNLQYGTFENNPVDVLFLQEYLNSWCDDDSSAQTDFIDPFFNHQEVTNPSGYVGHSICTDNLTINNYTSHNFSINSGSYPTYETAQIVVGGRTVNIINTHNDFRLAYQQGDVTDLLSVIEDMEYFILCGDFNIDLSTEDTTSDQYQNSVKRFLDNGYHVGNCVVDWIPTYFSTSSPTGGKYTDQIVTSANITIDDLYAYTEKLSDGIGDKIDHLPLIAELTIN